MTNYNQSKIIENQKPVLVKILTMGGIPTSNGNILAVLKWTALDAPSNPYAKHKIECLAGSIGAGNLLTLLCK